MAKPLNPDERERRRLLKQVESELDDNPNSEEIAQLAQEPDDDVNLPRRPRANLLWRPADKASPTVQTKNLLAPTPTAEKFSETHASAAFGRPVNVRDIQPHEHETWKHEAHRRRGNYGHGPKEDYAKFLKLFEKWDAQIHERSGRWGAGFYATRPGPDGGDGPTFHFGTRKAVLFLILGLDEQRQDVPRLRSASEVGVVLGKKASTIQRIIGELRDVIDRQPAKHDLHYHIERFKEAISAADLTAGGDGQVTVDIRFASPDPADVNAVPGPATPVCYRIEGEAARTVARLLDAGDQDGASRLLELKAFRFRRAENGEPTWLDICAAADCTEPRPQPRKYCSARCGNRSRVVAHRAIAKSRKPGL